MQYRLCILWSIILIYPPWHKVLRRELVYKTFLIISIIFSIISFCSYHSEMARNEKDMVFGASSLLLFLVFYKWCENYILKKYDRHLYFYVKYNTVWKDEESDHSTGIEFIMQFSLLLIPFIICWSLSYLFFEFLPKYSC